MALIESLWKASPVSSTRVTAQFPLLRNPSSKLNPSIWKLFKIFHQQERITVMISYRRSKTRRSEPTATATESWVGWTEIRAGATSRSLLFSPPSGCVFSIFNFLLNKQQTRRFRFRVLVAHQVFKFQGFIVWAWNVWAYVAYFLMYWGIMGLIPINIIWVPDATLATESYFTGF